jgi:hypothetical protein
MTGTAGQRKSPPAASQQAGVWLHRMSALGFVRQGPRLSGRDTILHLKFAGFLGSRTEYAQAYFTHFGRHCIVQAESKAASDWLPDTVLPDDGGYSCVTRPAQCLLNSLQAMADSQPNVMFPYPYHDPAVPPQRQRNTPVSCSVGHEFSSPPPALRLRKSPVSRTSVPKAAVQVHDDPLIPKNKIWSRRQHPVLLDEPN